MTSSVSIRLLGPFQFPELCPLTSASSNKPQRAKLTVSFAAQKLSQPGLLAPLAPISQIKVSRKGKQIGYADRLIAMLITPRTKEGRPNRPFLV